MLLSEYSTNASNTNHVHANGRTLHVTRYGLFGQVGGLLSLVKKQSREVAFEAERQAIAEEVGDILWYLCAVLREFGLSFDAIAKPLITDRAVGGISFGDLDPNGSARGDLPPDEDLNTLAITVSDVMRAAQKSRPADELTAFLRALINVAAKYDVSLERAAELNLEKVHDRWPIGEKHYPAPQDLRHPKYERFPDQICFDFIERKLSGGEPHVYMQVNGVNLGDRLTDNMHRDDGYRFHDVFHIAYAVHLGWSPVLRGLLKLKRKSDPSIDENEDGARAQIIEEGIATWIFNHAANAEPKFYSDIFPGKLPFHLLKQVTAMVRGYEVEAAAKWQWECAILDGFKVFRELNTRGGGRVMANFHRHELSYLPPEN